MGGAPDGGWFAYAPNTGVAFSPTHGMDFWVLALQITGLASLTGAINLIVTILNMRAPGMSLMRMPVFTWMILVTQFLLVFAIPVITVALVLLNFQRLFGATFFNVQARRGPTPVAAPVLDLRAPGGLHPHLAQLRHRVRGAARLQSQTPVRLPVRGVLRRGHRLHGLGRLGPPHVRLGPRARCRWPCSPLSTMFIAVPTGVKIINWTLTMWGGRLWFTTSMLFAIGLIVEFTIGGLSGVTHAISPSDTQQTDTYYIVAHFHYVLFGGAIFGIFAGFYYWWPKIFGRMLNEKLGKWNFWLMVDRHEPDVRPDAHRRPRGPVPAHYRVIPAHGLRVLEPGRDHRRLHPGHRRS